ncbi:hypothetical protein ACMYYO_10785 [Dermacoccaceae bacterium W4C1]
MTNAIRAELYRLCRPQMVAVGLTIVALYGVIVTWILVAAAGPGPSALMPIEDLQGPGGGTAAIAGAVSFTSVLVFALFIGVTAGDHSRGTWRAALLKQPNRLALATGQLVARLILLVGIVVVLFAIGWVTAALVAPGQGISTDGWFGADAWSEAATTLGRIVLFGAGWALLGTLVGTLTRSVPIGLALGVLWSGPIESGIAEGGAFAERWFPGLVLRQMLTGYQYNSSTQVNTTLIVYAVVTAVLLALVLKRRDVTQ